MDADAQPSRSPAGTTASEVALAYVEAINAADVDAAVACWAVGGVVAIHGQREALAPFGVHQLLTELLGAFPDLRVDPGEPLAEGERCLLPSVLRGTFAGPRSWSGLPPDGSVVEVPMAQMVTVRDGLIVHLESWVDSATIARSLGALPRQDGPAERAMTAVLAARTRASARLTGGDLGQIAEGVWRVQGNPARCNVYLLRDPDRPTADGSEGVLMFDAGARTMTRAVASAAARLGGLTRIVLGHGHTDHRGTAPAFDVPVLCHPDEVADAEGSGGFRYWGDLDGLGWRRPAHLMLHRRFWDGGPVRISATVEEGEEVAGFRVVGVPGHAPGMIALFRESDRLALTSDAFYTLDDWGRDCDPRLPLDVYNHDSARARESLLALAALDPAAAWPGHGDAVVGDVRSRLERAVG